MSTIDDNSLRFGSYRAIGLTTLNIVESTDAQNKDCSINISDIKLMYPSLRCLNIYPSYLIIVGNIPNDLSIIYMYTSWSNCGIC